MKTRCNDCDRSDPTCMDGLDCDNPMCEGGWLQKHAEDVLGYPKLPTHTLGPWECVYGAIMSKDGRIVIPTIREENEPDADRIVACVNACEGINPDAVGDMLEALVEIRAVALSEGNDEFAAIARNAINKARGTE